MSQSKSRKIVVNYFLYDSSAPIPSTCKVNIDNQEEISDLLAKIQRTNQLLQFPILWKPKAHLPFDLRKFCALLAEHETLPEFCDNYATDNRLLMKVEDLFAGTSGSRVRLTSRTALVIQVVPFPPASTPDSDPESGDVITQMEKRFNRTLNASSAFRPSRDAHPKEYREIQGGATPIFDGRYASGGNLVGLPVEIFHPAFAEFRALVDDTQIQPDEEVIEFAAALRRSVSKIATEETLRQFSSREKLQDLLAKTVIQRVNQNRTSADHSILSTLNGDIKGAALLCVVEEEPELGTGGDGAVQGSLSYLQHWTDLSQRELVKACFCPSFIISIAGPWFAVLGGVLTTNAIVQRLTPYYWIGKNTVLDDDEVLSYARVFSALRVALDRLDAYYNDMSLPVLPHIRYFPLPTTFTTVKNGDMSSTTFRYLRPLMGPDAPCTTFLVEDAEDSNIKYVVKFVGRYGEEAHRHLASLDPPAAPALLYCGDIWPDKQDQKGVGSRKMVVMAYINGKPLEAVTVDVRNAVKSIVDRLHQEGFVHGDIRLPNILVGDDEQLYLLDFDWAGREKAVRYPFDLSEAIRWPDGVKDNALIEKQHDLDMVRFL